VTDHLAAIEDEIRAIVLQPGEYALVEIPGITTETIDALRESIPDELQGRLLFVDGRVHTLKPGGPPA